MHHRPADRFRDLDDLQEVDGPGQPSRLGALALASVSGACIVFAMIALVRTPHQKVAAEADPLADLVARSNFGKAQDGVGRDITFPTALSDTKNTTALEIVRESSRGKRPAPPTGAPGEPPPPTAAEGAQAIADRLPASLLPAQHVLEIERKAVPEDPLSSVAREVSRERGAEVEGGAPGGYQLQVSSFKTRDEADRFCGALRRRGHKAYVEPAYVPGRGLWHRVRIGPFKYKHSAIIYRQDFEAKERLVTFIIDPPKTKVLVQPTDDEAAPAQATTEAEARLPGGAQ